MNPYIQQQVENMIDHVEMFVQGCHKAAMKDDGSKDIVEQYTIAEIDRLSQDFIKGLKKIH